MSKLSFQKVNGHFPLTIQNAKIVDKIKPIQVNRIIASNYQSDNVNPQQFYKPISKILQF